MSDLFVPSCRESLINQKSSLHWIKGFFCLQVKRFLVGFLTLQMSVTSYFNMMSSRLLTEFFIEGFHPEQSKLSLKVTLKSPPSGTYNLIAIFSLL